MPLGLEYRAQLASHDKYWVWKVAFRVLMLLIDIVAIILIAWSIADAVRQYNSTEYNYDISDSPFLALDYIPLGGSFIWCGVALLVHLIRKRPAHPGIDVGLDLVLWLAFAILAAFSLLFGIEDAEDDGLGYLSDGSGYYTTAANGSSVYISPSNENNCPLFESCAQQDQFEAAVQKRAAVELAAGALLVANFILHFALFVWGCIDTAARNAKKVHIEAKQIADAMIEEMVARGQLPAPSQPLLFQTQSQRESQVETQPGTRENSAMYPFGPAGYYAPQSAGALPAQLQQMQQPPLLPPVAPTQPMRAPSPVTAAAAAEAEKQSAMPAPPAEPSRSISPSQLQQQLGAELQHVRSGATSASGNGNGNGNGAGWHTPASQLSDAERAVVEETDAVRRPSPPARAPGHTYNSSSSTPSTHAL